MGPMTALNELADRLSGLEVDLNAIDSAWVGDSSVNIGTRTLRLTLTVRTADREEAWDLSLRLDRDDVAILDEGGETALTAYRQVIAANIGEWWNTGSQAVVVDAYLLA